eukprot:TRINITY_DN3225_c0_g1_i1.p1 TRINITY_DN3225_c0_g1~~TRINITY_DN3225_c0_g1_i1.p1  ORF type:complete len:1612 (-),score=534.39 TRINITY_DN3225_c0_g1_i1:42-4877(-)
MPDIASVRVVCRFRPVNAREKTEEGRGATGEAHFEFQDDTGIQVFTPSSKEPLAFAFDKIFSNPHTTQEDVYEFAAGETIRDLISGYNGTIFAYGQTGSGKSFSMFGPDISDPNMKGIIPRACAHIFEHIANDTSGTEYTIKCSFLEIYKEVVKDLLNPTGSNLKVRETPARGVWVEGLTEQYVGREEDVFNLLQLGEKYRAVSATNMNAVSSRSHSLFILSLHQKAPDGTIKQGRLNLADLAGSEKVGKTGATGDTLEEAKKINQSLSALGNCINALTKSKKAHIPYRDSKLTHILKESLGGNCKTTLLIACSPHIFNIEETISTLKFGQRAKTIKNAVTQNKLRSVEELNIIINKLNLELDAMKKYVATLEKELADSKGPQWDVATFRKNAFSAQSSAPSAASVMSPKTPRETSVSEPSTPRGHSRSGSLSLPMSPIGTEPSTPRSPSPDDNLSQHQLTYDSFSIVASQLELERLKETTAIQIQDLRDELKAAISQSAELEEEKIRLESEVNSTKTLLKKLESEAEVTEAQRIKESSNADFKLKQLQNENEKNRQKSEDLQSKNDAMSSELLKVKDSLHISAAQLEKIQQDKAKQERELEAATRSLANAESKLKELESKLARSITTQNDMQTFSKNLQVANKALEDKITQMQEETQNLQQSNTEMHAQLSVKQQEKDVLASAMEALKMQVASLEGELEHAQLERQQSALAAQEIQHSKDKEELSRSLEQLNVEHAKATEQMSLMNTQLAKANSFTQMLERKLLQEHEKANQVNVELKNKTEELTDIKAAHSKESHQHLTKIAQLEEQLGGEAKLKQYIEVQYKELQAHMMEKDNELKKTQRDASLAAEDSRFKIEAAERRAAEMEDEAQNMHSKVENLSEKVVSLGAENAELAEEIQILEDSQESLQSQLTTVQQIVEALEREKEFRNNMEKLSKEESVVDEELRARTYENRLDEQKAEYQAQLQAMQTSLSEKDKEARRFHSGLTKLQEEIEEIKAQAQQSAAEQEAELKRVRAELASASAKSARECAKSREFQDQILELERQLAESKVESESHAREQMNLEQKLISLKYLLQQKDEKEEERELQISQLEQQNRQLLSESKEGKSSTKDLSYQLEQQSKELIELTTKVKELSMSKASLSASLEESKQANALLRNKIELHKQLQQQTSSPGKNSDPASQQSQASQIRVQQLLDRALNSNKQLQLTVETLQTQMAKNLEQIVDSNLQAERVRMERMQMERKLNQEKKKFEEASEEIRGLCKELNQMRATKEELVISLQSNIEQLLVKLEVEQKQKQDLETQMDAFLHRVLARDQEIHALTDELSKAKDKVGIYSAHKKSLQMDLEQNQERVQQQEIDITGLSMKNRQLLEEIEQIKKEKEEMESAYQRKLSLMEEVDSLSRKMKSGGKIITPIETNRSNISDLRLSSSVSADATPGRGRVNSVGTTVNGGNKTPFVLVPNITTRSNSFSSPAVDSPYRKLIFDPPSPRTPKGKKELHKVEKEGLLSIQQGGILGGGWKKFWCSLADDGLYYFKDKTSADPVGVITLDGCLVKDGYEATKKKFTFVLELPSGTYQILANSQDEMDDWVIAINSLTASLREDFVRQWRGGTF